jgi:hypothetical protein
MSMKKNQANATYMLFMFIVFATSVSAQWTQTNWQESSSFFDLYTDQDRVFTRTWDSLNGGRMFFTADNGENWTQIRPADDNMDLLSIMMLSNGILGATWNGFYESGLDGTSWNAVTPAGIPADSAILSIAMIGAELYAGARGTIYKSVNEGASWTEIKSGIPSNCRITSFIEKESVVFAGSDTNGVFRTTNAGVNWIAVNSGLSDKHIIQLAALGSRLFSVTLKGVFISDNNGTTWTADGSGLIDINCLAVVNNQLFAGTDSSGVFLSIDDGATWSSFNNGMPNSTRVWSLAICSGNLIAATSSGIVRIPLNLTEFTITASASEGGTISPDGATTVYEYSSKTFTIAPDGGYRISDIVVDGASAGAVASYTFSNVTADHTISAVFAEVPTYTITASAGNGGTILPSGTVTVSEGSSRTFTISPLPGYAISTVTVDGSPMGAVTTYTFTNVSDNHTIAATFVSAPYTITASAGSGGSISPSGAVMVAGGASQTFTISASSGYEVSNVLIDGVSAGAVYSYTFSPVSSNHTISVSFSSLTTYQINCGGSASTPYTADQYYSGGSTYSVTSTITTTGVTDPAPQAVYQTERYGNSTYTIPNLTGGASYLVRLHFAEIFQTATGRRVFNVAINGTTVLSNYDIYAETGARYKAVVKEYTATANGSGQIVIQFTTVTDNAKISGIEISKLITNIAPAIATAAAASPNPVSGSTTALSVLGSDDKGESNLTYTWAAIGTPPAPVSFSASGTNAAKTTTATFAKAGSYSLQATVTDAEGMSVTSSVTVTVNQTLTSIAVSPSSAIVAASGAQQFTAVAHDQFAVALAQQPAFAWSASGGGTIDANGLFTAGTAPGTFTVTATSGSVSASANVTVNTAPTITAEAAADANPVVATTTALSVLGADDNGEANLTYTWNTIGTVPAPVIFSINGTNMAKATTANFTGAGSYQFQVTVTDQTGLTATSSVSVTVDQTVTNIIVSPASASVNCSATQQFTAIARDQFVTDLSPQPVIAWSVSGGGTIDANGLFTAGTAEGTFTVSASSGSVTATADITVVIPNVAPTIATAASASPNPVIAATTSLSVLGADDRGESNLSYTWTTTGTPPAPVSFSANGTNAAKNTTATFGKAGSYSFQVTVTDAGGLTATSSTVVTVNQTLASIVLSPASATVNTLMTHQFSATARDQFNATLSPQPGFAWSVSGVGTVNGSGLYSAGTIAGTATVRATSAGVSGTANVTVTAEPEIAYQINTGSNSAPAPFLADQYVSGGTMRTVSNSIDMSGVTGNDPAPQAVYQSERYGNSTYTIPNLTAGSQYTIRLHFAELYQTATGRRRFNVVINGSTVLSNFDIYAETGARYKATLREFTAMANGSGQIVINFTTVTDNATIEGIEILRLTPNYPPTIATPASANPSPVSGKTTVLSVLGDDDNGEAGLIYTWATTGTPPASVSFSANGTNGAKKTTATFTKAGGYSFEVTVRDQGNLTVTSPVTVMVNQTLTSIVVSPSSATVNTSATQQFSATARDQFAANLTTQPAFTWSVSGGGAISSSGLFTAGVSAGGPFTVTAQSGGVNGTASVTVNSFTATIYQINCGGSASSPYAADQYYSGGSTYSVTSTITTTGVTDPAPQAVYRTERYGNSTYTLPNLTGGTSYTVRLHFAEIYWTATGSRRFNVTINGNTVLSNYDIYAETGARYKAVVKEYTAVANSSGQIVINFTTVTDNAKIDGIEIIRQ